MLKRLNRAYISVSHFFETALTLIGLSPRDLTSSARSATCLLRSNLLAVYFRACKPKKPRATRIASHLSYDQSTDTSISFIVVLITPHLRHLCVLTAVLVKIVLDVMSCIILYTGLFISPSGISELDCATTKIDTAERSISIGRESLQVFFCTRGLGVLPGSTARG